MSEPKPVPRDHFTLWQEIPEGVGVTVLDGRVHLFMHKDRINDAWSMLEAMRTLLVKGSKELPSDG